MVIVTLETIYKGYITAYPIYASITNDSQL